ncbi:spermatogenesis-associated protein 31E1 isoform X4 [Fukomys damarensis]|uniref:spermatogenesis-associated protein 31E1 isoform X4 n=1 Tax=Fukomys damarensis TaxID=885580 RepID=UPI001454ED30|nr:spermatogenesis-associated protein 31E1 isoform X4 [Fukomys damarensis]
MRPNSRITRTTLRVQLPEGNATSQTMKRFLLLLKILHETWMSPSSTTWATDVILASACGLAHLIPLIPHLRTNLAFLLTGKRNNRKVPEGLTSPLGRADPGAVLTAKGQRQRLQLPLASGSRVLPGS